MAPRRDEYGRFMSDDDDDNRRARSGTRGSRTRYEDDDDREYFRQRPMSMQGRPGMGWRGRDEDDDDRFYRSERGFSRRDNEDDDFERGQGRSRRGFAGMDPEEHREISRRGGFASHGGRGRDYDEDFGYSSRWGRSGGYSRFEDDDYQRGPGRSRRGFAGMDPEEHREISRMGGLAGHGGRGRNFEDEDTGYNPRWGRMSERGSFRYEDDDFERGRGGSRRGFSRYEDDDDDRWTSSRRGFAGMDPEERREIARMGGEARRRAPRAEYGRFVEDDSRTSRGYSRSH